jgi:hypothetical protein
MHMYYKPTLATTAAAAVTSDSGCYLYYTTDVATIASVATAVATTVATKQLLPLSLLLLALVVLCSLEL